MEIRQIAERDCVILQKKTGCPVVFWASGREDPERIAQKERLLSESSAAGCLSVVLFEGRNWGTDYSPWPVEEPERYEGRGRETLALLTEKVIPAVSAEFETDCFLTAGYSLAALFALWALYERPEIICGAACCSGSLWYPGWNEYADSRKIGPDRLVYLSLGGKEPMVKDPFYASIGEKYRRQDRRLARVHHIYDMNRGGHFANPDMRVIKGISWLAGQLRT